MNILVVEDDVDVRKTAVQWLKYAFEDLETEVDIQDAFDDDSALQLFKNIKFDVVVLDMILKCSNKEIVDVENLIKNFIMINGDIRIIAVTGYVEHKIIKECVEKGLVEKIFFKAVDFDDVAKYIVESKPECELKVMAG
jgi:CheY-like chemotaxis protein